MTRLIVCLLSFAFASGSALAAAAQTGDATPDQAVKALEGVYGVHPGERRNHTKGTCALGSFVGAPEVARYSRSVLFSGATVPVVARFSLAGGNPEASDAERSPRGMALEFRLAGGAKQHMTMLDTPVFFAAVPRTFIERMLAAKPDPATGKPDPKALEAFAANHPEARAMGQFFATHAPPVSYANDAYYGIHTFKLVAKDEKVTLVKWRFVPQDGEKRIADDALASTPHDFLERALVDRAAKGPARWDMWFTIGRPGDAENDPTVAWPEDREQVKGGTLEITSAMAQKGAECEKVNYDPLVMSDGIAPTDDPVLRFRSPSYAISAGQRLIGK